LILSHGVVKMNHLALDILTWDKFYLSGRLHKPVRDVLSFVFLPVMAGQ
jgi:hypothetical protein